ncbi:MAG: DUF192 domain-containing protein [Candidatus Micrarchaeota archaeon]
MRGLLVLMSALLILGCSGEETVGYEKVRLPDGTVIDCEVPMTPQGMQMGLMYREGLCDTCGMLFVFAEEGRHGFWMKNMQFPIDIIFIDGDWRVVGIAQDVEPCRKEPCETYVPNADAKYVLEINANSSREHGIFINSRIHVNSTNVS